MAITAQFCYCHRPLSQKDSWGSRSPSEQTPNGCGQKRSVFTPLLVSDPSSALCSSCHGDDDNVGRAGRSRWAGSGLMGGGCGQRVCEPRAVKASGTCSFVCPAEVTALVQKIQMWVNSYKSRSQSAATPPCTRPMSGLRS